MSYCYLEDIASYANKFVIGKFVMGDKFVIGDITATWRISRVTRTTMGSDRERFCFRMITCKSVNASSKTITVESAVAPSTPMMLGWIPTRRIISISGDKFVIGKFVIGKFVIGKFVIGKFDLCRSRR